MADIRKTSRRAFLAGSAALPVAAFAAYRMSSTGTRTSDGVRVVTGGATASPSSSVTPPVATTDMQASSVTTTISAASLYARPLHFTYARQDIGDNKPIVQPFANTHNDNDLLAAFADVDPGITTIMPFFLNVTDLSGFATIINQVRGMNITIYPAVGADPVSDVYQIDATYYKNIVDGYAAAGFDCIRLENMQGYYETYGQAPIDRMIQYCIGKGFKHILLNPWPRVPPKQGGQLLTFNYPEIDATMYQVQLDLDKTTYYEQPDQMYEPAGSTNWQGNGTRIGPVASANPSVHILINYEAAPQHLALAQREKRYHDSRAKMQITLDWIAAQRTSTTWKLHWCPPFTTAYDGLVLGTWGWITDNLQAQT